MDRRWLLYGCYGFTGLLTARLAVARGMRPILAGRDEGKVQRLAAELNLDHRVFSLDNPTDVDRGLEDIYTVMHMAGPFAQTCAPMAEACLRRGVHYLDVCGDVNVFRALEAMDDAARAANVMVMPGCGWDVAASDSLALALKEKMPDAVSLEIAILPPDNVQPTKGTVLSILGRHDGTVTERINGELTLRQAAPEEHDIEVPGRGRIHLVQSSVADAVSAYHSTGIRNIRTFTKIAGARYALSLLHIPGARWVLTSLVSRFWKDPTPDKMAGTAMDIWGRARNERGEIVEGVMRTRDGYLYTGDVALDIVQRVLGGNWKGGYRSPAQQFGASLAAEQPEFVPYTFLPAPRRNV